MGSIFEFFVEYALTSKYLDLKPDTKQFWKILVTLYLLSLSISVISFFVKSLNNMCPNCTKCI